MSDTNTTKTTAAAKDWCTSSGQIVRGERDGSIVCPSCAQTVAVDTGVLVAHRDTERVYRKRLDLEIAQLEVTHAEKDLALAKARLAKATKAVTRQRGATKAQLAYRARLFAPASPSIHDLAALKAGAR